MNHLNIENPCNMCKYYRPMYIIGNISQYDKCAKIKSHYNEEYGYCDLERLPEYDSINECGSTGKHFTPSSKKERIFNHIKGFFFGVNSILIMILTIPFLIL